MPPPAPYQQPEGMTSNWFVGEQLIHLHFAQQDVLAHREPLRMTRHHRTWRSWWAGEQHETRARTTRMAMPLTP